VLLAMAGRGAAFVSDWFIAALNPAIDALHSRRLRGHCHRRDRGQRGRERRGDHARRQGQDGRRDLRGEELGRQIAAFLFPVLVLISLLFTSAPDVRARPGLHRALSDHRRSRLAGHGRRGGDRCPRAPRSIGIYLMLAFLTFYE
jgi:hypothetical protein